jgi:hypothetical protein
MSHKKNRVSAVFDSATIRDQLRAFSDLKVVPEMLKKHDRYLVMLFDIR